MSTSKIHTAVITDGDNPPFHYLVHENCDATVTVYLYGKDSEKAAYKTKVPEECLQSIAKSYKTKEGATEGHEQASKWVKGILYQKQADVICSIRTENGTAKLTWKKRLENGIKLTLGEMVLEEYFPAPSDMLCLCGDALQEYESKSEALNSSCKKLETENAQLRDVARQAVEAREQLERHLVGKFAQLLNEKKAKIRALHELLEERQADDVDRAPADMDASPARPAPSGTRRTALPDAEMSADEDEPASGTDEDDAYDRETDVDEAGDGGATTPPPAEAAAGVDVTAQKRAIPESPSPIPDKRRPCPGSDDLLDMV
ncbi:uncharacterized protein LOC119107773 isoform X2 [Pollicipes pollicipes]|uniref:uncharacterized protein LOC119107773 isoform X2 n=1 Tax=Pollicipes pollicipes TaxID=41117 RepID=UPI00188583A1|nr:uncharacterized protein LOC119107773 isoform X2 [Pollicipes pollicipes]